MAHFAKIENNIVTQVIVAEQDFIESGVVGDPSTWVQTSYNNNFAGIGYQYLPELTSFIAPKPFDSWTLDEQLITWVPPTAKPEDDKTYIWNEETLSWVEIESILPVGE